MVRVQGVGAFVELSALTTVASSLDIEDDDESAESRGIRGKPGSCSSSRFAFTVSHHVDSLKPWYLSLSDTSAPRLPPPPHRTPQASSLRSPAGMLLFRRGESSRCRESLLAYWKLYRRPYDERVYRSKMRPPLIVKRRHLSLSQRF